jgi:hypothetical protein
MSIFIKTEISNGALSEDVSSTACGWVQSPYVRYRALAGVSN